MSDEQGPIWVLVLTLFRNLLESGMTIGQTEEERSKFLHVINSALEEVEAEKVENDEVSNEEEV